MSTTALLGKVVAPKVQRKPSASGARMHLTKSPATLRPAAKRSPATAREPGAQALGNQHKPLPSTPKRP